MSYSGVAAAQGVPGGIERGSREGERAAGPIGGIVCGAIRGVVGGVNGVLGIDQRPRFHSYVVERHHPSYAYDGDVRVGADLPCDGITYYDFPPEYGVRDYRYTVVNGRRVLVDPRTYRIVEVIEYRYKAARHGDWPPVGRFDLRFVGPGAGQRQRSSATGDGNAQQKSH